MTDISDIQAGELHYETPDYGKPKSTEEFWAGEFGDDYTKRNRVDWIKRIPFWRDIVAKTGLGRVLEVGCNSGWNLSALRLIAPSWMELCGMDVNESALREAGNLHFDTLPRYAPGGQDNLAHASYEYDFVFTAGVLIHVAPEDLKEMMELICGASSKYVLAIEYFAEQEEEVEYRGHAGKLWKRPYGKLYQDLGLKLLLQGDVGKDDGFDTCRWWLLEKP